MTIYRSGEWWKGSCFDDLAEYIVALETEGYSIGRVLQARCSCGHTVFGLQADWRQGCALRTCASCGKATFICDSEEYWKEEETEPETVKCVCGGEKLEIGVGFSFRDENEIRWITVGHRCVTCGTLASYVNWKINYGPSIQLLDMV